MEVVVGVAPYVTGSAGALAVLAYGLKRLYGIDLEFRTYREEKRTAFYNAQMKAEVARRELDALAEKLQVEPSNAPTPRRSRAASIFLRRSLVGKLREFRMETEVRGQFGVAAPELLEGKRALRTGEHIAAALVDDDEDGHQDDQ